jgi:gamma-glutamyl-gamma-aminobutyrate hydrolase PuuD
MNIGLSQRVLYHKNRAYDSLEHGWYHYLKDHKLHFISNRLDQDFESLADSIECLIITGGDDSSIRRATEFKIASAMMKRNKPIIGFCHGAFMLSDALGATIVKCDNHMDTEHTVKYGNIATTVNSHHSNAIKTLHKSATPLVFDEDGNCEAWIDKNIAGVVWHPQRMEHAWIPEDINLLFNKMEK